MRERLWQVIILTVLLLTVPVSQACAQGPDGDRLVFGQSFVLSAGQRVDGNVAVVGGSVVLEEGSVVTGDIAVVGGGATIAGTVEGNLASFGGAVVLQDSAVIQGNIAAFGGEVRRAPGAVVRGDVFAGLPVPFPIPLPGASGGIEVPDAPWPPQPPGREAQRTGVLGALSSLLTWQLSTLGWALLLMLLGLVVIALAPKAMSRIASAAADDALVSFGMGLLTLIVGLLSGLLLLVACCFGLFVWLALGAAWLVGWIAVGLWLGQRLLHAMNVRSATALGEAAVGILLITILSRVPWCIGFLFGVSVGCIGLGAVVLARFGTQPYNGASSASRGGMVEDREPAAASLALESPSLSPADSDRTAMQPGDDAEAPAEEDNQPPA